MAKKASKSKGRSEENLNENPSDYETDFGNKKFLTYYDLPKNHEINLPYLTQAEHKSFMDLEREYWKNLKPRNWKDYLWLGFGGGTYQMWRMPPELHEKTNTLMKKLTEISAATGQEEAALGFGVAYAVSRAIYGIKTNKPHHTLSGLNGIVMNAEKINNLDGLNPSDKKKFGSILKISKNILGQVEKHIIRKK